MKKVGRATKASKSDIEQTDVERFEREDSRPNVSSTATKAKNSTSAAGSSCAPAAFAAGPEKSFFRELSQSNGFASDSYYDKSLRPEQLASPRTAATVPGSPTHHAAATTSKADKARPPKPQARASIEAAAAGWDLEVAVTKKPHSRHQRIGSRAACFLVLAIILGAIGFLVWINIPASRSQTRHEPAASLYSAHHSSLPSHRALTLAVRARRLSIADAAQPPAAPPPLAPT